MFYLESSLKMAIFIISWWNSSISEKWGKSGQSDEVGSLFWFLVKMNLTNKNTFPWFSIISVSTPWFSLISLTTRAEWIDSFWKLCLNECSLQWLKPKRNLVTSFISEISITLNTLFEIILINSSKDFLNTLYGIELHISKINQHHTGKKRIIWHLSAKYSDLKKNCLMLLLLWVW